MRTTASLTHKKGTSWLVSAGAAAALAMMALAPGSAEASTAQHAAPAQHANAASASGQEPYTTTGGGSEQIVTPAGAVPLTGSGCVTIHTYEWIADSIGIHLAQFNMSTYWCWNNTIVTTHSTSESGTVTFTGSLGGWQYKGLLSTAFNCFYWNSYKCSGNHETAQGNFEACQYNVCYSTWYPILQQWEDAKPNWWASYS